MKIQSALTILEEDVKTNGHFAMEDDLFKVPSSIGTYSFDISIPFDITMMRGRWYDGVENKGDFCDLVVSPNTVVGAITSSANIGDTVISVQQSVVDNVDVGYWIDITDLSNTNVCGRCVGVDKENLTITVETPLTHAFSPTSPTYVRMSVKMAHSMSLMGSGLYVEAEGAVKGAYIPKDTVIRVYYNNIDGLAKDFHLIIEYLY